MSLQLIKADEPPKTLTAGFEGERRMNSFFVDYGAWKSEFGSGTLYVVLKRVTDAESAYFDITPKDSTISITTWTLSDAVLAQRGKIQAQFVYNLGLPIKKSRMFELIVQDSLPMTNYE